MSDLTIPESRLPAFKKLRTVSDESLRVLAASLQSPSRAFPPLQGVSPEDSEELRNAVKELYGVREYFDQNIPEFVADVVAALQEQESEPIPVDQVSALEERLTKLLSIDSLSTLAKAESLKLEYERRFCTARILTDARPIYGADPSDPPTAAMVMHTMRISYHDDTLETREIYVTMDDDDMAMLREILDRADAKSKSLKSFFAAANLNVVAP